MCKSFSRCSRLGKADNKKKLLRDVQREDRAGDAGNKEGGRLWVRGRSGVLVGWHHGGKPGQL
jgi:hypothetical protein